MFSSVNFRALLDRFQAIIKFFSKPQNPLSADACPFQHIFLPNSVNSVTSMSKEWRKDLEAYEDAKKFDKLRNSNSREWSEQESLTARSEKARQLITLTNHDDILALLGDNDVIKLLSERRSLVRRRGNTEAHKIVEQGVVLEDMVHQCAAQLESFEVAGLLAMIKMIRPEAELSNTETESSNDEH